MKYIVSTNKDCNLKKIYILNVLLWLPWIYIFFIIPYLVNVMNTISFPRQDYDYFSLASLNQEHLCLVSHNWKEKWMITRSCANWARVHMARLIWRCMFLQGQNVLLRKLRYLTWHPRSSRKPGVKSRYVVWLRKLKNLHFAI